MMMICMVQRYTGYMIHVTVGIDVYSYRGYVYVYVYVYMYECEVYVWAKYDVSKQLERVASFRTSQ